MSEPQPAWSRPGQRALNWSSEERSPRRAAKQKQQLQMVQTNPSGGGALAPLPWQPSRAGDWRRAQPGELVGGSGAHRRESRAPGPWAEAGPHSEAPPQGTRAPPPHGGGFLAAARSPARQARAPPSRPFGFELPARGEGRGHGDGGGGAGRARRTRGERDKQPPTWLLPPRPPLLQYGLWRPRAAEPRRVSPGQPDTVSSSCARRPSLLQPGADSRVPKPRKRRRRQQR